MIVVFLLLAAVAASAQPLGDGVPLLRQVAEAAQSAKGWRAEGTLGESPLTVSKRGPLEMRYSIGRATGILDLTVCDGSEIWNTWYSGISSSWSMDTATATECTPAVLQWASLLDSLKSAILTGKDDLLGCTQVWADYAPPTRPASGSIREYRLGPVAREICIDEPRELILWERFYLGPYVVSLTKIERDPDFGLNEFKAPPHSDLAEPSGLYLLNALPLHFFCSGSLPSVGCAKNPLALHDGN